MLIVVSDFHLSEGRRPGSGKFARTEDFFFDDQLTRFLEYLQKQKPGGVHLVINGDFIDFLQVGITSREIAATPSFCALDGHQKKYICRWGAKTDETASTFKLEKVYEGHPVAFEAFGNFLSQGNRITIIIGNHDIEFTWPKVQARFRELCAPKVAVMADGGRLDSSLEFAPWIYLDHEYKTYIEHGHQYESLNSFRYFLYPVLPGKKEEINLPFGSLFVRYLLNKVERINPFADNIRPSTKYVAWVFHNKPLGIWRLTKLIWQFTVSMTKIFKRSGNLSKYRPDDVDAFEKETNIRMADIAKSYHLSENVTSKDHPLQKIQQLHQKPFNDGRGRFAWQALFANLDVMLFVLSALTAVIFVASFLSNESQAILIIAIVISIFSAAAGDVFDKASSKINKSYFEAANNIGDILGENKIDAKYIVFGHTHTPEIAKLNNNRLYFNTGTWGVIFDEEKALIREKKQFAFLSFPEPNTEPMLMRWNDNLGLPEQLPLFDSD